MHAPDSTISDTPGSGSGRLLAFSRVGIDGGAPVTGRVHVTTEVPLTPEMCAMLPPENGVISGLKVLDVTDKDARVQFTEAQDRGKPVASYEIRYLVGGSMTLEQFLQATPASVVEPGMPGATATVKLIELRAT
jgi:hypothetical protein